MAEQFQTLAAVVAAHPDRKVVGRTRLQKTVKLLQRLGLPTSYNYSIHFYGPYSEDLQSDVTLLERVQLATEEVHKNKSGDGSYYVVKAATEADPQLVKKYQSAISLMASTDPVVLELAATYDAFREEGDHHKEAMERLKRKKGSKCDGGNDCKALKLLGKLGLPNEDA
jgi:uncharacterized protein YwgA